MIRLPARLRFTGRAALTLHPRVPSFDNGTLAADGSFTLGLANLAAANLVLRNWCGLVLPRPAHIDSALFDPKGAVKLFDVQREPIAPWRPLQLPTAMELPAGSPEKSGEQSTLQITQIGTVR